MEHTVFVVAPYYTNKGLRATTNNVVKKYQLSVWILVNQNEQFKQVKSMELLKYLRNKAISVKQ